MIGAIKRLMREPVLDLRGRLGNAPVLVTYQGAADMLRGELRQGNKALAVRYFERLAMTEKLKQFVKGIK